MWFGHGTKPRDAEPVRLGNLEARISSLAQTAIASVPGSKRSHPALRFGDADRSRLVTSMRAWVGGLDLSRESFAWRLFGHSGDSEVVTHLREAAVKIADAKSYADMRAASDALGEGMQAIGLDNWSRFLESATQQAQGSGLEPRGSKSLPQVISSTMKTSTRAERVAKLVKRGVDATQADVDAAIAYVLTHVPDAALGMMEEHGVTIYVTRGSVARQLGSSPDTHARGPDNRTVSAVPAIYDKSRSRVIIATQDDGKGGRRMPDNREHGSVDAVLHELGHGVDNRTSVWSDLSNKDDFTSPYKQDGQTGVFAREYYHQDNDGRAGRSELWAEGFAMYMSNPAKMSREYPHLFAYFFNKYPGKMN